MSALTTTERATLDSYELYEQAMSALQAITDGGNDCHSMADLQSDAQRSLQMVRAIEYRMQLETGLHHTIHDINARSAA
jgi:hypothetical protein